MALDEVSSCGRNWYLTEALVEEGLVIKPTQKQIKNRIYTGSLHDLFLLLTVMVDLDKTLDVIETASFQFTDVNQCFILKVIFSSLVSSQTLEILIDAGKKI